MPTPKKPKVILFDVGGVCVLSPFQAILDYELSLSIPPGWINHSISATSPDGFWHRLETGTIPLDSAFYAGFNADLHDARRWRAFYASQRDKNVSLPSETPPVPNIDGEWLFHEMIRKSASPDPWIFPALKNLKKSGEFILGALSNTIIFPVGHPLHREQGIMDELKPLFDFFVSSAHVGLRKPDPRVYQLAVRNANEFAASNAGTEKGRRLGWGDGVSADEIVFLDDIGENLREARRQQFRTIKVPLGRSYEAVEELERITGLSLDGGYPKVPMLSSMDGSRARI